MFYKRLFPALCVLALMATLAMAQKSAKKLTNQDVIDMVSLGLSDQVVIDKIHSSGAVDFDTSLTGLKALKAAKVSDAVIRTMINPQATPAATTSAAEAPPADSSGLPEEVGVYSVFKGKVSEVEPEIVGWQTGGVMKSMVSGGLTKGHVNGKVMKPKSPLQIPNTAEFIIKTPEGTSVTEYQLLRLDEKSDRREFRSTTGGIIHASGGAERNAVELKSEKIANRTWRVKLTDLKKGEYGFLPPGVSSQSVSSSGKIYSFGILE